jgi:hypothetical protein
MAIDLRSDFVAPGCDAAPHCGAGEIDQRFEEIPLCGTQSRVESRTYWVGLLAAITVTGVAR